MLIHRRIRAGLNFALALVFAAISLGAFMDGRWQGVPLAIIFLLLSVYCVFSFIKTLREGK